MWGLLCHHQQIFSLRTIPHTNSGGTTEYIIRGKKFTKIDLSQAYHQLELTPESRKYTTINTHLGLYQYKRLTFGVSSAVSIFQRTIENVLKDLPGCCVRIDDILISGETDEVNLENLHRVLTRLQDCGLKLTLINSFSCWIK